LVSPEKKKKKKQNKKKKRKHHNSFCLERKSKQRGRGCLSSLGVKGHIRQKQLPTGRKECVVRIDQIKRREPLITGAGDSLEDQIQKG